MPMDAKREQIIKPVLIGSAEHVRAVVDKATLDLGDCMIVDIPTEAEAAATAVRMVREGNLHTDVLMHAVLCGYGGLRTSRRISHVFLIATPGYSEIPFVTDAAINIFPDLDCKRDIVQNAIDLHIGLGLGEPRALPSFPPLGNLKATPGITKLQEYRISNLYSAENERVIALALAFLSPVCFTRRQIMFVSVMQQLRALVLSDLFEKRLSPDELLKRSRLPHSPKTNTRFTSSPASPSLSVRT